MKTTTKTAILTIIPVLLVLAALATFLMGYKTITPILAMFGAGWAFANLNR